MKRFIKKPKCSKCGSKDISMNYHTRENGSDSACWRENTGTREHICHHCRICGYGWVTKTLPPSHEDKKRYEKETTQRRS